mgnify:FL=1
MLIVTLHAQVQPVFVDLRSEVGGRWELSAETTPEPNGEEGEGEEEEETKKSRCVLVLCAAR